jgi:hypothetical protein
VRNISRSFQEGLNELFYNSNTELETLTKEFAVF